MRKKRPPTGRRSGLPPPSRARPRPSRPARRAATDGTPSTCAKTTTRCTAISKRTVPTTSCGYDVACFVLLSYFLSLHCTATLCTPCTCILLLSFLRSLIPIVTNECHLLFDQTCRLYEQLLCLEHHVASSHQEACGSAMEQLASPFL